MAKLIKLKISGIRNFSPKNEDMACINFQTPVTLLLGQNGCGKTTIIECLKYACTGDVPAGSSNGQNFIHDPKINGTLTTKGFVALKIIDVTGRQYGVQRIAQVTQKQGKLTFSSVDSAVSVMIENGKFQQLPGRCADVGTHFTEILGISKPILNYVIFCHQDDSLWPLDEGKILKERFDKIFAVESYTKSVDTMLALRKEAMKKVKIFEDRVRDKETNKKRLEADQAELSLKESQLEKLSTHITKTLERKVTLEASINSIVDQEKAIIKLEKEIDALKAQTNILEEKKASSLRFIGESKFSGDEEELVIALDNFGENVKQEEALLRNTKNKKEAVNEELKVLQTDIKRKSAMLGGLKKEQEDHKRRLEERSTLLKKSAAELNVPVNDNIKDESEVNGMVHSFQTSLKAKEIALNNEIKENAAAEKNMQTQIYNIREEITASQRDIKSREDQIKKIDEKCRTIENQLAMLAGSSKELINCQEKVKKINKQIEDLIKYFNANEVSAKIFQEKQKILQLQNDLDNLESDYKVLKRNAITEHEIERSQKSSIEYTSSLEVLKNKNKYVLNELFGDNFQHGNYKKQLDIKTQKCQKDVNKTREVFSFAETELAKMEAKVEMESNKLYSLREKADKHKKAINDICNGRPYKELSLELYEQIEGLQRDKGQYSSAKVLYETFTEQFQKQNPSCPVCNTDFNNKKDAVKNIVQNLQTKIKDTPMEIKRIEKMLQEKQQLYDKVLQLGPINEELDELTDIQIPFAQDELDVLQGDITEKKENVAKLKSELHIHQNLLGKCNNFVEDCCKMDKLMVDLEKETQNIANLKDDLVSVASNKTREQVEIEIEDKRAELEKSRSFCDTENKRLTQNKDRELQLKGELNDVEFKRLEIEKVMQGRPQLEEQLDDLKKSKANLKEEMEASQKVLMDKSNDLEEAEQNMAMVKAANEASTDNLRKENVKHEGNLRDLNRLQNLIKEDLRKDVEGQFNKVANELTHLVQKEQQINDKLKEFDEIVKKQDAKLSNQQLEFEKLNENKKLFAFKKEDKHLSVKLKDLEVQLGNANKDDLINERRTLAQQYSKLQSEEDKSQGQKKEIENAIASLKATINSPENKNVIVDYRRTWFTWKVNERVAEDLKVASDALECAILKFHEGKMRQINEIIREYWMQIYRGNDIDYIEVKTEMSPGTSKRRSYNYRVVQMKNGIELDMRGRCSAGQKVLACLIIRMALSETFSSNCGILALDEPTTNLDKENIASLSEALAGIIETRRQEKNFQLVVITHDEEFVETLMQMEKLNFYYKVQRNQQGNSEIIEMTM